MVKDSKSGQGKLPSVPLKPLLKNISETLLQCISFHFKTHFFFIAIMICFLLTTRSSQVKSLAQFLEKF